MRQLSHRAFLLAEFFYQILECVLIRLDFAAEIFEELFERLSFIGLDKMIHQFQGADGTGKVIVQIDSEFFFAHVPIAF